MERRLQTPLLMLALAPGVYGLVLKAQRVVEIKTSQGEYDALDVARSLQFGAYELALEGGGLPPEIELLVLVKRSTPKLQQLRVKQTTNIKALVSRSRNIHRARHRCRPVPAGAWLEL